MTDTSSTSSTSSPPVASLVTEERRGSHSTDLPRTGRNTSSFSHVSSPCANPHPTNRIGLVTGVTAAPGSSSALRGREGSSTHAHQSGSDLLAVMPPAQQRPSPSLSVLASAEREASSRAGGSPQNSPPLTEGISTGRTTPLAAPSSINSDPKRTPVLDQRRSVVQRAHSVFGSAALAPISATLTAQSSTSSTGAARRSTLSPVGPLNAVTTTSPTMGLSPLDPHTMLGNDNVSTGRTTHSDSVTSASARVRTRSTASMLSPVQSRMLEGKESDQAYLEHVEKALKEKEGSIHLLEQQLRLARQEAVEAEKRAEFGTEDSTRMRKLIRDQQAHIDELDAALQAERALLEHHTREYEEALRVQQDLHRETLESMERLECDLKGQMAEMTAESARALQAKEAEAEAMAEKLLLLDQEMRRSRELLERLTPLQDQVRRLQEEQQHFVERERRLQEECEKAKSVSPRRSRSRSVHRTRHSSRKVQRSAIRGGGRRRRRYLIEECDGEDSNSSFEEDSDEMELYSGSDEDEGTEEEEDEEEEVESEESEELYSSEERKEAEQDHEDDFGEESSGIRSCKKSKRTKRKHHISRTPHQNNRIHHRREKTITTKRSHGNGAARNNLDHWNAEAPPEAEKERERTPRYPYVVSISSNPELPNPLGHSTQSHSQKSTGPASIPTVLQPPSVPGCTAAYHITYTVSEPGATPLILVSPNIPPPPATETTAVAPETSTKRDSHSSSHHRHGPPRHPRHHEHADSSTSTSHSSRSPTGNSSSSGSTTSSQCAGWRHPPRHHHTALPPPPPPPPVLGSSPAVQQLAEWMETEAEDREQELRAMQQHVKQLEGALRESRLEHQEHLAIAKREWRDRVEEQAERRRQLQRDHDLWRRERLREAAAQAQQRRESDLRHQVAVSKLDREVSQLSRDLVQAHRELDVGTQQNRRFRVEGERRWKLAKELEKQTTAQSDVLMRRLQDHFQQRRDRESALAHQLQTLVQQAKCSHEETVHHLREESRAVESLYDMGRGTSRHTV